MKALRCFLIILWTTCVICLDSASDQYLDNDPDDSEVRWKNLFTKLDRVLAETESLNRGLLAINQKMDRMDRSGEHSEFKKRNEMDPYRFAEKLPENGNETPKDSNKRFAEKLPENGNETPKESNKSQMDNAALTELMKCIPEIRVDAKNSHPWTAILRRQDGTVEFNRNWTDYKNGFGDVSTEFFIGLEAVHNITTYGPPQELLVIMRNFANETRYAKYDQFEIGTESEKYALTKIGAYSGDAGDGLNKHKGHQFSTADGGDAFCASIFGGGWWFYTDNDCYASHLTGPYRTKEQFTTDFGINWETWGGSWTSLAYAEMLIRPKV